MLCLRHTKNDYSFFFTKKKKTKIFQINGTVLKLQKKKIHDDSDC